MRILVLFDVHPARWPTAETLHEPESLRTEEEKPTEADVLACLRKLGHDVETPRRVRRRARPSSIGSSVFKPDVVFNLCETFFSDRAHEPNIPALLELMKVPLHRRRPRRADALQGQGAREEAPRLPPHPRGALRRLAARAAAAEARNASRYPAFVKPIGEESSDGIALASLAKNEDGGDRASALPPRALRERRPHRGVRRRARALPRRARQQAAHRPAAAEIFFGERAGRRGRPDVARQRAALRHGEGEVGRRVPEEVGDPQRAGRAAPRRGRGQARELARRVYRILHIRRARTHRRAAHRRGGVVVIEANPNPSLAKEDDFAQAAAGRDRIRGARQAGAGERGPLGMSVRRARRRAFVSSMRSTRSST